MIVPFSLFFHELGHAIGAKITHASNIILTIGYGNKLWTHTIRNITIVVRKFFFLHGYTETSNIDPLNRRQMMTITIMGPIFNIFLCVVTYICYIVSLYLFSLSFGWLYLAFLFNVWLGVVNLIPFKIGQKHSDGFMLFRLLIKKELENDEKYVYKP